MNQDVEGIFGLVLPELIYGNDFGGHLDSEVEERRRRRTTKIGKGNQGGKLNTSFDSLIHGKADLSHSPNAGSVTRTRGSI